MGFNKEKEVSTSDILGKTFYPSVKFRNKIFLTITTFLVIIIVGCGVMLGFIDLVNDKNLPEFVLLWFFGLSLAGVLITVIFSLIFVPMYVRRISYRISDDEIIVNKGIISHAETHIPFRTITNVNTRTGPFDRLIFGIGAVEIQTAGFSGSPGGTVGPEAKIDGIENYIEVRELILLKLRGYKKPYTTTTEPTEVTEGDFQQALLKELREIKALLKK